MAPQAFRGNAGPQIAEKGRGACGSSELDPSYACNNTYMHPPLTSNRWNGHVTKAPAAMLSIRIEKLISDSGGEAARLFFEKWQKITTGKNRCN